MSKELLEYTIKNDLTIQELENLRDHGLAKIIADPDMTDFTEADVAEFTQMINDKIIELGGTI